MLSRSCFSLEISLIFLNIARLGEEVPEIPFRRVQEVAGHKIVLRLTIGNLPDCVAIQAEKGGAGVA
jgi:hypothetical protein